MLLRSLKPGPWSAAGAPAVLLVTHGTGAQTQPVGEPRASAVRIADRGHRPAARLQVPRGDRSRHTEVQRTDNGHSSQSTITGANGRTATRDSTVVNDRESGTRTRDVTYNGVNGRVTTANTVTTRTDEGHVRETTVTRPSGATGTHTETVSCDRAAGKCTRDVQVDMP